MEIWHTWILGYNIGRKDYRLFDLHTRKVISSRHVIYDKHTTAGSKSAPDDCRLLPKQWECQLRALPDIVPDPSPMAQRRSVPQRPVEPVDDDRELTSIRQPNRDAPHAIADRQTPNAMFTGHKRNTNKG